MTASMEHLHRCIWCGKTAHQITFGKHTSHNNTIRENMRDLPLLTGSMQAHEQQVFASGLGLKVKSQYNEKITNC